MIKKINRSFLVINCTGKNDSFGLYVNNKFFTKKIQNNIFSYESLVSNLLNFLKENQTEITEDFSILINRGPGSFSAIRISLAVAKGLEIAKKVKLFGYKDIDLKAFSEENIERLLSKNLIEKKLIKPIYFS